MSEGSAHSGRRGPGRGPAPRHAGADLARDRASSTPYRSGERAPVLSLKENPVGLAHQLPPGPAAGTQGGPVGSAWASCCGDAQEMPGCLAMLHAGRVVMPVRAQGGQRWVRGVTTVSPPLRVDGGRSFLRAALGGGRLAATSSPSWHRGCSANVMATRGPARAACSCSRCPLRSSGDQPLLPPRPPPAVSSGGFHALMKGHLP